MTTLFSQWYAFLGQANNFLSPYLSGLSRQIHIPMLSALLLGLLGSTAPCQLSTNFSALGLFTQKISDKKECLSAAFSFTLGKLIVYTLIGSLTILLGIKLNQQAIPFVQVVRKGLSLLMIIVGLYLLGLFKTKVSLFTSLERTLTRHIPNIKNIREFCLGVVYALAFCPTLFWLFFGIVIPLGVSTHGGIILPGIFAIGTVIPLLVITVLLVYGIGTIKLFTRNVARINVILQKVVGVIFILAGINDLIAYWLI
ncbi:MAG: sulfite exporter TauE/SafE family protein [Desulfitobacteriaceae bacterium]